VERMHGGKLCGGKRKREYVCSSPFGKERETQRLMKKNYALMNNI